MSGIKFTGIAILAVVSSGCATTPEKVHEVAAMDMKCPKSEVTVTFEARPRVGSTRYRGDGCGKQRSYVCQKPVFLYGLPIGSAACRREPA